MRRRAILSVLVGTTLAGLAGSPPSALGAQRSRIAILHSGYPERTPIHELYRQLRLRGYEDGRTAEIALMGAQGDLAQLDRLVAAIGTARPDVVVALTPPAVVAIKRADLGLATVFAFVGDPVAFGLVDSLARPGGSITGVAFNDPSLGGKRVELLLDALPATRRIAVLWNRDFPENLPMGESARHAAEARGIEVIMSQFGGFDDLPRAFQTARAAGAEAGVFVPDNMTFGHRPQIAAMALEHRLPTIHNFPPEAVDGALMSFGGDLSESYERVAAFVDRILHGAKPATLPVESSTRFRLVVNLKTARALGLVLPESLLARADEVVE